MLIEWGNTETDIEPVSGALEAENLNLHDLEGGTGLANDICGDGDGRVIVEGIVGDAVDFELGLAALEFVQELVDTGSDLLAAGGEIGGQGGAVGVVVLGQGVQGKLLSDVDEDRVDVGAGLEIAVQGADGAEGGGGVQFAVGVVGGDEVQLGGLVIALELLEVIDASLQVRDFLIQKIGKGDFSAFHWGALSSCGFGFFRQGAIRVRGW